MSTHRTRRLQQQQQYTAQTRYTPNGSLKQPPTFNTGIVIPVIFDIIICTALCIVIPLINKNTEVTLPKACVPLVIVAALIAAVLIVVSYVKRQYMFLKGTYQSLEQGMADAAAYTAQQMDFVEYPVNSQPYSQYPQYGQPQMTYPTQGFNQNTASINSQAPTYPTEPGGIKLLRVLLIIAAIIFGYFIISASNGWDVFGLKSVEATITSVESRIVERTDNEGDTYEATVYDIKYVYTFNSTQYTGEATSEHPKSKSDIITVYLNPDNPTSTYYFESLIELVEVAFLGLAALFIAVTIIRTSNRINNRRLRRNN